MPNARAIRAAWRDHDRLAAALADGPGRVFTPRETALRLAEATLAPLPPEIAPRLLDPACGPGALLLAALEWAARERPHWLDAWLGGGLSGWDARPEAATACNAVLTRAAGGPLAAAQARDALTSNGETFDAVLANPPWISYSGRHARSLAPERREALARRFAAFRGWPSLHTAFAQRCAELTAPQGRAGLLLPLQMADLEGYRAARDAMALRHRIEAVHDLGEGVFAGVVEPTGMFVLAPRRDDDPAEPVAHAPHAFAPLPPACFGDVGVHTGNAAGLLLADAIEPDARPLRVGRDIEAYRLKPPSLWLRSAELPEGRYARVAGEARYRDALIVLRQTASRPVAARHEPWALFRNSILACYGAPGHDPDFLVGVLNSDTMAAIHRAMFRDARQKAFPQVKIGHLRKLPVPGREIGPLYERIANAARAADAEAVNGLVAHAYEAGKRL